MMRATQEEEEKEAFIIRYAVLQAAKKRGLRRCLCA